MIALIVDPSRTVTHTLSALFARHGFDVRIAGSGAAGLEIMAETQVDILCFAYELGDMDGIELFVTARSRKFLRHQPGVMFTSTLSKQVVDRALEAGVTECFQKRCPEQFEHFVENFAASNGLRMEGRILLVEDSKSAVMYYREVFKRLGLKVDVCGSAEDAIMQFAACHYDLVVTDYMLSGIGSGFAVIRAVRESPGKKALTPILAISSFTDVVRKVEVLRNGASDFVSKPVVTEELEVRVCNLLKMQNLMRRLESQHDAMKNLAMRDPLTKLFNRHHLHDVLPGMIVGAHEAARPLSLLVFDVDHFKRINDFYGHKLGDEVLEQVARMLQGMCRCDDIAARIGGEEFVVALPGVPLIEALNRAETVRLRIVDSLPSGIKTTVSVGVASLERGEDYDSLFVRADAALYRAKHGGRNRVEAAESGCNGALSIVAGMAG